MTRAVVRSSFLLCFATLLIEPTAHAQTGCIAGTNAALDFDGQNDWVRIPDHSVLENFDDFTIEAWFRADSIGGASRSIVQKFRTASGTSVDDSWLVHINPQGRLASGLNTASGYSGDRSDPLSPIVSTGVWHHFAFRRAGGTVTVLLDGMVNHSYAWPGTMVDSVADVSIGCGTTSGGLPTLFFDGTIDDVRIWNVARSDAALAAPANASSPASGTPGLVALWRLDDVGFQLIADGANQDPALAGTRGAGIITASDDPTFDTGTPAPLVNYCGCGGPGQENSAAARLLVNATVADHPDGTPGPFVAQVAAAGPSAGQLTMTFEGPAFAPYVLVAGPLTTGCYFLGASGTVDISVVNFVVLFDGASFPGSLLFNLGPQGTSTLAFTLPLGLPAGVVTSVQAAVYQAPPPGSSFPLVLTAAWQIVI